MRINSQQLHRVRVEARGGNDIQQRLLARGGEVCRIVAGKAGTAGRGAIVERIAHVSSRRADEAGDGVYAAGWKVARGGRVEDRPVRKCWPPRIVRRAAVVSDIVLEIGKAAVHHAQGGYGFSSRRLRQDISSALIVEEPKCLTLAV